jgi:hypothetical protein
MEQRSSWEANSHSAGHIIFRPLWNPMVHYRVYKGPLLLHILSQMNPFHTLPPYYPKSHSNIILLYTTRSSKWSLSSQLSNQNICMYVFFISPMSVMNGVAQWYRAGLRVGWSGGVRFPAGDGNFSLHHRVQTDSRAHPASYPICTEGSLPGGKAAGEWSWSLTPSSAEIK